MKVICIVDGFETDHKPRLCRFLGSFEPLFDFVCGGSIRKLNNPRKKKSTEAGFVVDL